MLKSAPLIRVAVPLALLALTGCAGIAGRAPVLPGSAATPIEQPPANMAGGGAAVKVAMLLPLSGKGAAMGTAMQNAAQLALNDLGYPNFELLFEDTGSNAGGAEKAARAATAAGARLLIGPIFAEEAKAARPEIEKVGANMLTFSTDTSVASAHSFVMGILPQDQARQMAEFAAQNNARRVLVVADRNAYGQIVVSAFARAATANGLTVVGTLWIDSSIASLPNQLTPYLTSQSPMRVDAVFMPLPADRAARLNRMIGAIPTTENILRLATGLLDDANVTAYPDLVGTYYAAPSPQARVRFEQSYRRAFGDNPPRLASLGYDAVALSLMMARTQGAAGLTATTLTNASGFTGIDGLFRFRPDGVVERALAVIQIQPGARITTTAAPTRFLPRP